jgi:hypothetical protein
VIAPYSSPAIIFRADNFLDQIDNATAQLHVGKSRHIMVVALLLHGLSGERTPHTASPDPCQFDPKT